MTKAERRQQRRKNDRNEGHLTVYLQGPTKTIVHRGGIQTFKESKNRVAYFKRMYCNYLGAIVYRKTGARL